MRKGGQTFVNQLLGIGCLWGRGITLDKLAPLPRGEFPGRDSVMSLKKVTLLAASVHKGAGGWSGDVSLHPLHGTKEPLVIH